MLVVLDANEYIFGLGSRRERACEELLDGIVQGQGGIAVRISRLIVNEVRRNLTPEAFKAFLNTLSLLATPIDEDEIVPFEFGSKYEWKGLKPADAFIAAYAEGVGADILVSENRHFLSRHSDLPFKVLSAQRCLALIA